MLHLLTAAAKTKFGCTGVLRHAPASGFFRRLTQEKSPPGLGKGRRRARRGLRDARRLAAARSGDAFTLIGGASVGRPSVACYHPQRTEIHWSPKAIVS